MKAYLKDNAFVQANSTLNKKQRSTSRGILSRKSTPNVQLRNSFA